MTGPVQLENSLKYIYNLSYYWTGFTALLPYTFTKKEAVRRGLLCRKPFLARVLSLWVKIPVV